MGWIHSSHCTLLGTIYQKEPSVYQQERQRVAGCW
jgi:hypothetical protein